MSKSGYSLSDRKCASVKALMSIKDVTADDARAIRQVWRTVADRKEARAQIDAILKTCGVEYLGWHKRNREHVYYCNAGDAYTGTILFTGLRMHVGCYGDLVERNLLSIGATWQSIIGME